MQPIYTPTFSKCQRLSSGKVALPSANLWLYSFFFALCILGGYGSASAQIAGKAINLNGSGDYVNLGNALNSFGGSNMTVEAWVYPTSRSGLHYVLGNETNSAGYFIRIIGSSNTLQFFVTINGTGVGVQVPATNLALNKWSHIAGTYDGTTVRMYINGTLMGAENLPGTYSAPGATANTYIGECTHPSGPGRFWAGQIDEVRIWNVTRSQSQIQAAMLSPLLGNETGLMAYYNMENIAANGQGQPVADLATANGAQNGTTVGTASTPTSVTIVPTCSYVETLGVSPTPTTAAVTLGVVGVTSGTPYSSGSGTYVLNTNLGTINACGGDFYDSGGAGGSYSNNENRTVTFCSSNGTDKVRLSFTSFSLENAYDFLYIHDGPSTSAPLIGTYTGGNNPGIVTSSASCLTVRFTSDFSQISSGWAASLSCLPVTIPPLNWKVVAGGAGANATAVASGTSSLPTFTANGLTPANNYDIYTKADFASCWQIGTAAPFTAQTTWGNVLDFDGSNDYVSLPTSLTPSVSNGTAITVEYWYKGTNSASAFRVQDGSGNYMVFPWSAGNTHIISTDGGTQTGVSAGNINDGNWHHVAITWQKNTANGFRSYLDGRLVQAINAGNVNLPNFNAGTPILLGSFQGSSEFMQGSLDEVRIWNVARTEAELATYRFASVPTNAPGLLAYYKCDQGVPNAANGGQTTLIDAKSGANGTLNNFALTGNVSNWIARSPILTAPTAANVSGTNATLGATIGEVGTSAITERGVLWATTNDPNFTTAGVNKVAAAGTATGVYTVNVSNLAAGTTIYYVGYALTNDGIGYSPTGSFVTSNPCPAVSAAPTITNIGLTTATLEWTSAATAIDYNWKVVLAGAGVNGTAVASGTTAALTVSVSGLSANVAYDVYVQTNCAGPSTSAWSPVASFSTSACPAVASAPTVSNIAQTSATIDWTSSAAAIDYTWKVVAAGAGPNGTAVATGTTAALTQQLTALTMGTSYEVYVRANCTGPSTSAWSAAATFSTLCDAPTGLQVSNIATTSATLAWTTAGVSNYAWKIVASGAGVNATAVASGTTTSTTVNVTGLAIGSPYDCYVQTVCSAGTSAWTSVVSFSTACDVPLNLTVSNISYTTATLNWNAASTANYDWKIVAAGAGSAANALASGSTTTNSASVTGLSGGVDYEAYVRTNCSGNSSDWSVLAAFTTLACNAIPNNITAFNVTYTTADFTWDPIANIQGYNWKVVASGAGSGATAVASGTAATTTITVTGLAASSNYDFFIQTNCGSNSASAWSNPYTFSTNACNVPTGFAITQVAYTDAILNWTSLSGVMGYTWKVVAAGGGVNGATLFTGSSLASPDTISGLASGTNYEVYLQTNCSASTNSAWTSALTFTTNTCTVPTGLTVSSVSFDGLVLSWTPQPSVYNYAYKVVNAGAGVNATAVTSGNTATAGAMITGLSASTSYDVYVETNCAAGLPSGWSSPITFTTLNCNRPLNVMASNQSFTGATLRWTPIAGAQEYACKVVAVGAGPNAPAIFADTVLTDSVRVEGLVAGTTYDFYAQTRCSGTIFSDFSTVLSFSTENCVVPTALTASNVLPGSATLTWSSVNFSAKYYWKVVPKGAGVNAVAVATDSTNSNSITVAGLAGLTAYDAYVSLHCGGVNNNSAWSNPVSFSTPLLPSNAPWVLGAAGWFNGINDHLTLGGGLANPNDFTIEFWVRADSYQPDTTQTWFGTTDKYMPLVERTASGQTPYAIRYNPLTGLIKVLRTDGSNLPTEIIGNTNIKDGTYHHVAVTRNSLANEMKLYVDGVLDGTAVDLTNAINPTGAQTRVAARMVGASNMLRFRGNIDELRFWDVVRQVSDIQNAKDAMLTGTEVGLLAYYDMENVTSGNAQIVPSVTVPALVAANGTTTGTATTPIFTHPCEAIEVQDVGVSASPTTISLKFSPNDLFASGIDWKLTALGAGVNNLGLFSGTTADTVSITGLEPATAYDLYIKSPCTNTWGGPVQVVTQNNWRNALDFDGVNDHLSLGNGSSFGTISNAITVEAWVRPSSNTGQAYIFNKETASATGGISLYLDQGIPTFAVKSNNWATAAGTEALPINKWAHIAGVYNGSGLSVYVNGRVVASSGQTGSVPAIAGNAFVGKRYDNTGYWSGMIDELRVWNVARTASHIQNNLFAFPATNSTGLVAYYAHNEGTGNASNTGVLTAIDATANANNGTLSGFALSGNTSNWVARSPVLSSPVTGVLQGNNVTVYDSVMQPGTAPVLERGFIWSIVNTTPNTLILGSTGTNKVPVSGGVFAADLTGLPLGATITYRAYAYTADGIGYSTISQNITTGCPAPENLVVSNIATNTALIKWTSASTGASMTVKVVAAGAGVNGAAVGSVTIGSESATVSGLSALSTYDVYVRMACTSISSAWTGPVTFTTLCNPVNLPMTQNFSGTAGTLPACWTRYDANEDGFTWALDLTGRARLAPNATGPMNDWLFSGGLNMTAGVSYRIAFTYGAMATTSAEKLALYWGTAADVSTMSNTLFVNNGFTAASTTHDLAFTPTTTGVYYLGWKGFSDGNSAGLYIDNVSVDVNPCGVAPATASVTNTTATSTTAAWAAVTGSTSYNWKVVASSAGANAIAVRSGTTTGLNASVTNLFPGMSYDLFVKAICSANISSEWVGPIPFNTLNQTGLFASTGGDDAFVEVNWSLPVDNCLLNASNTPYPQGIHLELKDLTNNQIIFQQPIADLSPYIGQQQPTFTQVANGNNTAFYQVASSAVDNFWVSNLSKWTIETWLRITPSINNATIWSATQGANTPVSLKLNGQILSLNNVNFSTPIPHSRWTHIAVSFTGTVATLYINGDEKESKNLPFFNMGNAAYTYRLLQNFSNGHVGEFRLWNRVRTATEIANNRFATSIPNAGQAPTNLFLHLRWNTANTLPTSNAFYFNPITYSTGVPATLAYTSTPNYTPINGIYRHLVGPSQTRTYQINVRQIGSGLATVNCSTFTAIGNTLPFQPPVLMAASDNQLDRVSLTWKNKSKLGERFSIVRDGVVRDIILGTDVIDSVMTYHDVYDETDSLSVVNGVTYNYCLQTVNNTLNQSYGSVCDNGQTTNLAFSASDNTFSDKVVLTWANVAAYNRPVRIKRDGVTLSVIPATATTYTDNNPTFGKVYKYEMSLLDSLGLGIMSAFDNGSVPAKGEISGRVVTQQGGYAVKDVRIILSSLVDTTFRDTVYTNHMGEYAFTGLYYGVFSGKFVLSAKLGNHKFTENPRTITLSDTSFAASNVIFHDSTGYTVSATPLPVSNFVATPNPSQDRVEMAWTYSPTTNDSTIFEVYREGKLMKVLSNNPTTVDTYTDLTGTPQANYIYKLFAYKISNGVVTQKTILDTTVFPPVTKPTALTATVNGTTGTISLTWANTSANIQGFNLYKNAVKIAELPSGSLAYTDVNVLPGSSNLYSVRAKRKPEVITFESAAATSNTVTASALPNLLTMTATPNAAQNKVTLSWTVPANLNTAYNFTGYRIYRKKGTDPVEYIGQVFKGRPNTFDDKLGMRSTSYVYTVKPFRKMDNGTIAEAAGMSRTVTFPAISSPSALTVTNNTVVGAVVMSWTPAYNNGGRNLDGQIVYNGTDTVSLPLTTATYRFMTNKTATTAFGVRTYRIIGGKRYYSNAVIANAKPLAASVNPVLATNFKASQDLPNHIRLSWDYPSYVSSTFKLYRDNALIATLATTVRTYQDYNAVQGVAHQYHIEATNGANTSQRVGAWGSLKSISQLSGIVNTAQKVGMPNVDIVASAPGFYVLTRTDSAGYYVIDGLPTIPGTTVTVTAEGNNCTFTPATQTFNITNSKVYNVNFVNTFTVPATDTVTPAKPINVSVLADYARRRVAISWNESNTNYDGVEVYRANTLLGTIEAGSDLVLYDTDGYPGISYVYSLRPFKYIAASTKLYGTYGYKTATFPIIEDVLYLTATPKPEENKLTLTWSHRWDNHTYYVVERNDELMTTVQCGQPLIWDDLTGEPGKQYTYAVKAIMSLNNVLYSSNVVAVTATYPAIGEVKNLTASVPSSTVTNVCGVAQQRQRNHVLLTWESTTTNVNGYRIYRDNNLIAAISKDSLFYKDEQGLPGSLHTYTVRAVLVRNELSYNSIGVSLSTTYPTLSAPRNLSAPTDSAGAVRLSWVYPEDVIDGFFLYYNGSTGTNIPSDTFAIDEIGNGQFVRFHNSGLPGVNYQYAIRAYTKRSGVTYLSPAANFVCNGGSKVYPAVVAPTNAQATDGLFEHHVVVTWDYPNTANATGIEVFRNGSLLERVPFGLHSYTDLTVTSNSSYHVRAYRTINGVDYYSANSAPNTGYPLAQNSLVWSGGRKFGRALAQSENVLLVGAPGDNPSQNAHIMPFRFNPLTRSWAQGTQLSSTGAFGNVFAVYGNNVIAGAPGNNAAWAGTLTANNTFSGSWLNTGNQPRAGQAVAYNQYGYYFSDQRTFAEQYVASYTWWFYCFCNQPNYAWNYHAKAGYVGGSSGFYAQGNWTNRLLGAAMEGGGEGLIFTSAWNSRVFQVKQSAFIEHIKPNNIPNNHYGYTMAVSRQHDAIIAAPIFSANGNGVVYIHNDGNTTPAATLTCPDNGANNRFGQAVDIEGNFAIIGAPGLNGGKGAAYLYHKKNNSWSYVKKYDYAATTPDSVGSAVRVGNFAVVGAPNTNNGEGKIYWEDLRLGLIKNVVATNGDYVGKTQISWSFYANANVNVSGFRIYRDGTHILTAAATDTYINDETGIPGKHYIYEVAATDGTIVSATYADEGWSQTDGYVEGSVSSLIGSAPIPGVKITATAIIKGDKYTYSTLTDNAGLYSFPSLYYSDTTVNYIFEAEYAQHSFVTNPINLLLSPQSHSKTGINFYDKTSYTISGFIHQKDVTTGLDSIKVTAIHELIDGTQVPKEVYTDKNGKYNLVINPAQVDLAKISIQIADKRILSTTDNADTLRYKFVAQGPTVFTNFSNFPVTTTLDVMDTTRYPVRLSVITACNTPLIGGKYKIKVQGVEAGYEKTFTTSDQTGELTTLLPPLKYSINVESVDNLNSETQLVVNYLKFRSSALDLYTLDKDTLYKETNPANVDALTRTTFVYHKPPTISIASGFDRYMCNNANKPAIIEQGEEYGLELRVQETFSGSACDVRSGYLIISNAASQVQKDTVYFNSNTQQFDEYIFTAGNPNLVSPYSHLLNVRYFSNSDNLLGEKNFAVIVEGASQLPGSDVIVDLSENGEVPIPLFVLRDPPGDGSSMTIEKGSTTTKSLTITEDGGAMVYLGSEGKLALSKVGLSWGVDFNIGGGKTNSKTWEISATTTESISTYGDPAPVHIGEQGDVIVGMGLALQYGLTQQLKVSSCDTVKKSTVLGFSPHSIRTQWMYTVGQMEALVSEYDSKIEAVKAGTLILRKPDGSVYTQDEAILKLTNLKKNWEQMLVYHKRETLPYYALCDKTGQRKAPEPYNTHANNWRDGFCPLVGSYGPGGKFIPTDNIIWDQVLVDKYNAANTAIRKLESGELTLQGVWAWQYDGFANTNNYVDQQYNLLHGVQAENITFGSGIEFSKTYESAESKSQSSSINFGMDFSAWLGLVILESTTILTGTPIAGSTTEMSAGDIVPIKGGASFSYTVSEERGTAKENTNLMSYTLSDDDEADQFSVTIIQGPATNLGPYFSLLGGRSSCPEEPGTIVRDRPDLRLYDPETQATTTEQTKSEIPTDAAATFMLQITNMSVFNEARDFKLTLKSMSNPNGAVVTTMGQNLGYGPVILYGMNPEEPFIVPINVQRGLNGYDYEGLTVSIEPYCGNTAEATDEAILLDSTTNFSVVMNVYFKNPCSKITLVEPDDNWVIGRRNLFDANSRENMMVKFMDYEPYNEMLLGVRMEYRKLGAGAAWQTIPGTVISRDSLRKWNEQNFVASQIPYYPYFWDITDDFASYPDGDYEIRVVAECGVGGQVYSRYAKGKIARQGQLFGKPEPADHIWTLGDEISVAFNRDLDCISIADSNFVVRSKTQPNTFLPGTVTCYNNKLLFTPTLPLRYYDGDSLELVVANVRTDNGYLMDSVRWAFFVVGKDIYVKPDSIKIVVAKGEDIDVTAMLAHNSELASSVNYGFTNLNQYKHWLSCENPSGSISVGEQATVRFQINTTPMLLGTTTATLDLDANGTLENGALVIQVTVVPASPDWEVNPADYNESMTLLSNFNFDNSNVRSQDTMDIISVWIDNQIRGVAKISKFTATNYAALIQVYGKATDAGKTLTSRVWDASAGKEYDARPDNNGSLTYATNNFAGSVGTPYLLDIFTASDEARYIPLNKGWSWLSVASVNWNKPVNQALASLRHPHTNDVIKTANKTASYLAGTGWVSTNGLDSTNVHRGYQIYLEEADTLRISGAAPTLRPISLLNGWNLIGYPLQTEMPITGLNFTATPTSMTLKTVATDQANYSPNMVATYASNAWTYTAESKMSKLRPNFAYQLRVNTPTQLLYPGANPLVSPVALRTSPPVDLNDRDTWEVYPADFEYNQLITAVIDINKVENASEDSKVMAYVGDECRGVGKLSYVPALGRYMMQMMVYGNEPDELISFRIYDGQKDRSYDHFESISFGADGLMGKWDTPYRFSNVAPENTFTGSAYPNPFNRSLKLNLKSDKIQNFKVSLTDLTGRLIYSKEIESNGLSVNQTLNTQDLELTDGVYLLHVVGSLGETLSFKVVYQKND